MKKLVSSKPALIFLSIVIVLTFCFSLLALGLEVSGLTEEKGSGYLSFIIFGIISCPLLVWYLNRAACVIWFENGIIKRKGLLWGFYKECAVNSIQRVVVRYAWREGDFIYLVDDHGHHFDRTRKNSYICFYKTKETLAFVRTFWSGPIEQ